MNVNSTQCEFEANLPVWSRARDVIAGEDVGKAAGERYLPRWIARRRCYPGSCAGDGGRFGPPIGARKVALPRTCQILFCSLFVEGFHIETPHFGSVPHDAGPRRGVEKSRVNFASR